MKKITLFTLALMVVLPLITAFPNYSHAQKQGEASVKELKFFSGSPAAGGVWYLLSVGITQIFEKSIPGLKTSLIPGGAGGSPISVGEGGAQAGLANLGPFLDGQEGLPPYKKAYGNLRVLATLYDHVFQIIVLKDSGINKIADLKGKVVSPGIKGQYSEFWFKKLLSIYGMNPEKDVKIVSLGFGDTVQSMKDGKVDCLATAAPIPMPSVEDLATARDIKFLSIDNEQLKTFCATVNGFEQGVLRANKIPFKGKHTDVMTAFLPLVVIVRADLPDEVVYRMAKSLAENTKSLETISASLRGFDPKDLARRLGPKAVFHPGAVKYYKERGWQ